jgi:hypothetical protein
VIPAAFSKDGKIVKEGEKPIDAYSDWMTSKDNPRFTTRHREPSLEESHGHGPHRACR